MGQKLDQLQTSPRCVYKPWFAVQDVLTDMDQYVQSDDGHFQWTEVASYNYPGATLYIVNMTSQMWKTGA